MAKTKISQFDATAANNTDLNSISIAEGTAPSNINNAIRELMSQLADLNLGNEVLSTLKIDNLHLDGNTIVTLDTNGDLNLTPNGTGAVTIAKVDINGGAIDGTPIGGSSASTGAFTTLSASSTANLGSSVTVSGGNIDGVIGANTPAAITGTVITANTNFAGNLTGNVTGTVDGVVGGTTPAAVTGTTITANTKFVGAIDGNVTATSGTSTFNNVTINGTLDMDSTTSQTITGLATPSGSTDAATKGYVDTEVSALVDSAPSTLNTLNELAAALGDDASFSTTVTNSIAAKLPLAGGTMTGDIDANSNTVSGLKAPSASNDATTKTYVDTADALKLNLSGGTLSGNLAMGSNKVTGLDTPTASGDATTKGYVDGILGSATAAATSASAAATSATSAATSATASASSATAAASSATSAAASYDSFDDRYLGAKSSAPTVDNDGDALVTGALYFNTSSNQLFIWSGSAWTQAAFTASGFLSGSNNLSDVDNAGTARTNLGLAIGTNVQAFDADLSALAGLTSAADKGIQFTGSGTAATYDLTSAGKALLDDADAAAQRTTLGLGTAATTASTDYATAAQGTKADNAAAKASNLSDLASASTARTNLGLGTAATLTAGTSANNAVQLDGSAKLPAVDGSALTGLASGGTVDMVADGAIAIRKPVIRTAAGKAKQVAETTTVASDPSTKLADLDGSDTTNSTVKTAYEPTSGKFVMIYKDTSNSSYPSIVAGTWDDNNTGSITWGTPEVLNSAATIGSGLAVIAGNGRIHATYQSGSPGSGNLNLRTATIGSDLTFSGFSTAVDTFGEDQSGTYSGTIQLAFDTSTNYLIATYSDATDGSGNFYAIPIHINGTTYTTGSPSTICSGNPADYRVGLVFDPDTNRTILAYKDNSNSGYTTVNVIQSAGTAGSPSLTVGSDVVVDSGDAGGTTSLTYDTTNNKVFLAYENSADTELKGAIGTVNSGTNSISFTTPASIKNTSADFEYFDMVYFEDQNKIYFVYRDRDDGDDLTYLIITPGASSFSVGSAVEVSANQHEVRPGSASAGVGKGVLFGLQDSGDSSKVAYLSFYNLSTTTTVLTKDNYLGVSDAAISDGATGKIVIPGGISEGHSSLTVGSRYFTNGAGTIGLAGNARGFEFIGKAISATQIQLQDREFDFYADADGAITKGGPIEVASGKIKAIVGNSMQFTDPTTADDTGSNGVVEHIYDVNAQRSVVYYIDTNNSNYMVSVVVNASSSAIVATGTPVVVASETAFGEGIGMATYDPDTQRQIAFWGDNGNALRSAVGTVTAGTNSISWGSVNAIGDAAHNHTQAKIAYDENVDRLVVAANRNFTGSGFAEPVGSYYVGTVTGGTTNTISWTSAKSIRGDHGGGNPGFMPEGFAYAPNIARLVLVFVDHRSNNSVETIVGTTTGGTSNSVSWTSDNTWLSSSDISNGSGITSGILTHDPDRSTGTADVFSFVFGANYDSNDMKAVRFSFVADGTRTQSSIIDVEGNTTQASTAGQTLRWGVAYNADTDKHILTAHDTGGGPKVKELTIGGDGNTSGTISAGEYSANLSGNTSDSNYIAPAYNVAAGKIIVAYNDNADSNKVKVRVNTGPAVASTKTNFDGFAQFAASDGNVVAAKLDYGIDTNQSGLTAGSTYYLDSETALTTTSTSNQKVGVALTDTDLQIVKT